MLRSPRDGASGVHPGAFTVALSPLDLPVAPLPRPHHVRPAGRRPPPANRCSAEARALIRWRRRCSGGPGRSSTRSWWPRIRIHGDYHLARCCSPGRISSSWTWREPSRSLSERRFKRSPLRDVARHDPLLRVRGGAVPTRTDATRMRRLWLPGPASGGGGHPPASPAAIFRATGDVSSAEPGRPSGRCWSSISWTNGLRAALRAEQPSGLGGDPLEALWRRAEPEATAGDRGGYMRGAARSPPAAPTRPSSRSSPRATTPIPTGFSEPIRWMALW